MIRVKFFLLHLAKAYTVVSCHNLESHSITGQVTSYTLYIYCHGPTINNVGPCILLLLSAQFSSFAILSIAKLLATLCWRKSFADFDIVQPTVCQLSPDFTILHSTLYTQTRGIQNVFTVCFSPR